MVAFKEQKERTANHGQVILYTVSILLKLTIYLDD